MIVLGSEVGKIQKKISSINGDIKKVKEVKNLEAKDKLEIIEELKKEKEGQMNMVIGFYNMVKEEAARSR